MVSYQTAQIVRNFSLLTYFLPYLQVELNYELKTIQQCLNDVLLFFKYILEKKYQKSLTIENVIKISVQDIRTKDVKMFLSYLKTKYKNTTLQRKFYSLYVFFIFCLENGYIKKHPMGFLSPPKVKRKTVKQKRLEMITFQESRKLMDCSKSIKELLIIRFLLMGLSITEISNININNIDIIKRKLKVNGEKIRYLKIDIVTFQYILRYIENGRNKLYRGNGEKNLLLNRCGKALSNRSVQRIVKKCRKQAKIKRNITPIKKNLLRIYNLFGFYF